MRFDISGINDKGLAREENQDAAFYGYADDILVAVVADGMGGHSKGETASAYIVRTVESWWKEVESLLPSVPSFGELLGTLRQTLENANAKLWSYYTANGNLCGSTVSVLLCSKNRGAVLNCGDSRVYRLSDGMVECLTVDDVWENQPTLSIEDKSNLSHPNRGKLVASFGSFEKLPLKAFSFEVRENDRFMLCTDGLHKVCSDAQIETQLRSEAGLNLTLQNIKQDIYNGGAVDNFAVLLCRVMA